MELFHIGEYIQNTETPLNRSKQLNCLPITPDAHQRFPSSIDCFTISDIDIALCNIDFREQSVYNEFNLGFYEFRLDVIHDENITRVL